MEYQPQNYGTSPGVYVLTHCYLQRERAPPYPQLGKLVLDLPTPKG